MGDYQPDGEINIFKSHAFLLLAIQDEMVVDSEGISRSAIAEAGGCEKCLLKVMIGALDKFPELEDLMRAALLQNDINKANNR